MSGTNASDPPSGKALPGVRLRGIAESSSGPSANIDRVCKDECLQMIDWCVQILETAISSSWDFSARDRLQRPPTKSNCAVYNEHAEVRGCYKLMRPHQRAHGPPGPAPPCMCLCACLFFIPSTLLVKSRCQALQDAMVCFVASSLSVCLDR